MPDIKINFPKYLHFKSDDTICELQETVNERKRSAGGRMIVVPTVGKYKYIKAISEENGGTFINTELSFSLDRIGEMISKNIIKTSEDYDSQK